MNNIFLPLVHMFTDGACSGNPGPGGYGVLLIFNHQIKKIFGGFTDTTANVMELTAILQGLMALMKPCRVVIHTDSANCIGWLSLGWKRKNPLIRELCERIDACILAGEHEVTFEKVKGHSGDKYNEIVDRLAVSAIPSI